MIQKDNWENICNVGEQIINTERILRDQKIAEKWAKLRQFSKEEIQMSGDFLRIEVWHKGTLMFFSCCHLSKNFKICSNSKVNLRGETLSPVTCSFKNTLLTSQGTSHTHILRSFVNC